MDERLHSPIQDKPQDGSFSDLGDPEPAVCEDTQTVFIEEDEDQADSSGPMLRTPAAHPTHPLSPHHPHRSQLELIPPLHPAVAPPS